VSDSPHNPPLGQAEREANEEHRPWVKPMGSGYKEGEVPGRPTTWVHCFRFMLPAKGAGTCMQKERDNASRARPRRRLMVKHVFQACVGICCAKSRADNDCEWMHLDINVTEYFPIDHASLSSPSGRGADCHTYAFRTHATLAGVSVDDCPVICKWWVRGTGTISLVTIPQSDGAKELRDPGYLVSSKNVAGTHNGPGMPIPWADHQGNKLALVPVSDAPVPGFTPTSYSYEDDGTLGCGSATTGGRNRADARTGGVNQHGDAPAPPRAAYTPGRGEEPAGPDRVRPKPEESSDPSDGAAGEESDEAVGTQATESPWAHELTRVLAERRQASVEGPDWHEGLWRRLD
jgi:hypothetical protein